MRLSTFEIVLLRSGYVTEISQKSRRNHRFYMCEQKPYRYAFCTGTRAVRYISQLMNEAEYLMKNYGARGGCYPSRP